MDIKYLKYLLISAIVCASFASLLWLKGMELDLGLSFICFVVGAIFTSAIVVRIPIFRRHYRAQTSEEIEKYGGYANTKAAPVMAGLITGGSLGACLYIFGVTSFVGPTLIGALSSVVVSLYYEKWL